MKKQISIILTLVIFGIWQYVFIVFDDGLTVSGFMMSIIFTFVSWVIIYCIMAIVWRVNNGVDLLATLETDPEKVKERMLTIMQYGHSRGVVGALNEFNDIFRNYPQWELAKWEVFRAWYKDLIDHALEKPEIYNLSMKDGSRYEKEFDPLYDPDAPDWEQFDRPRNYDDEDYYYDDEDDEDDDEDDDDDFDYQDNTPDLKKAAKDGLLMGIGFGIANNILNV